MVSRTQSRKSVATWSLRERAVCSRPAAGPTSSASRLSTFIWMSSSARENVKRPRLDFALDFVLDPARWRRRRRPRRCRPSPSMATWAFEPAMSWARELAVEVDGGVDLLHDLGGTAGEPAAPHLVAHALSESRIDSIEPYAPSAASVAAARRARRGRGRRSLYGTSGAAGKDAVACRRPPRRSPRRLAPLAQGEVAALNVAKSPTPPPALIAFEAADGKKLTLADFKGRARAAQPVGDLVRALPRRNAGARPAAGGKRAARTSRSSPSTSTPRGSSGRRSLPRRDRREHTSPATPTTAPTPSRPCGRRQGAGPADQPADRPRRLRDRRRRRPRELDFAASGGGREDAGGGVNVGDGNRVRRHGRARPTLCTTAWMAGTRQACPGHPRRDVALGCESMMLPPTWMPATSAGMTVGPRPNPGKDRANRDWFPRSGRPSRPWNSA